jgi:cysteine desulfurase
VRVSLGRNTTADELGRFVATFAAVVQDLKNLASVAA